MVKSKWNVVAGVFNVINAVLFLCSWFLIAMEAFTSNGSGVTNFLYIMAAIGTLFNIVAWVVSHKRGISIVGPVLGFIGSILAAMAMIFALPSMVLVILGAVFEFLQHPSSNTQATTKKLKY